ncbi:MAG: N-acetylmuramoyl-L-alanine amidase, family 2 [Acidimicrobiales bacterium]|nr:N-acetylmuramoyl-L-alanine amidase, family 2 [Acidimicrobiales bacterium]
MKYSTSALVARPRTSRRARRVLLRLTPLAVVGALITTGLVAPVSQAKPTFEARTLALTEGIAGGGFTKALHTGMPTEMVGFDWEGRKDGLLELRVLDHGTWSPWTQVDSNVADGPDRTSREYRDHTTAGPVWVGKGVRDIQVRVVEGSLPRLHVHTIRSEDGQSSPLTIPAASADPAWPNVILRDQWGADESWRTVSPGCNGTPDYAPTVQNAFVHHTVNSNTYAAADVPAMIRGIYYFHTHTNGWCDIGYNFLVDRFGRIFEGRYGGVTRAVIGAHAGGFNTGSTGVSMLGDFTSAPVPAAMYNGVRTILTWKLFVHKVDANRQITVTAGDFSGSRYPAGTRVNLWTISGHRDVDQTDCPGNAGYSILPRLRLDVQNDLTNTPPYPYGWWAPVSSGPGVLVVTARGGLYPAWHQSPVTQTGFWPGGNIVRAAMRESTGGLVADLSGGLHPFGGAPVPSGGPYWPGQDIVRGVARGTTGTNGYVLDDWGGLHPFGGAPPPVGGPWWQGRDVARGVVTAPGGLGGYVLDSWGGVHPFGTAPAVQTTGYWQGQDVARGIALRPDGKSGYVLDDWGGLHPFGGAPGVSGTGYWPGRDFARGLTLNPSGPGGWVVEADGGVWAFGGAPGLPASLSWTGMGLSKAVL